LKELNLDNIPIVAQSYDGVSLMSGCRGGLQTLLKKYHPSADDTVHCMAHRLNLVVVDMCKNVKVCTICIIYEVCPESKFRWAIKTCKCVNFIINFI